MMLAAIAGKPRETAGHCDQGDAGIGIDPERSGMS